jgi:hypothetical protein
MAAEGAIPGRIAFKEASIMKIVYRLKSRRIFG